MSQTLELRVLTGLHRGARCPVQDGATIGSDTECDIVLADAGIAAHAAAIHIGPAAWCLRPAGEETGADTPLAFNAAGRIGTVSLTVSTVDTPWPQHVEATSAESCAKQARSSADDGPPPRRGGPDNMPPGPFPMREGRRTGTLWAVAGILAILVFGGVAVASFSPSVTPRPLQGAAPPSSVAEALDATRRALRHLGLQDRVSAYLSEDQHVWVTGWVHDDAEHDRLAAALASIWPGPLLKLENQARVRDEIVSFVRDLDIRVAVDYQAAGTFTVRGIAASQAIRDEAVQRWTSAIAGYAPGTARIMLVPEVEAAVQAAALRADVGEISVGWSEQRIIIGTTELDEMRRTRLNSLVETLNDTYLNALVVTNTVEAPPSAPPFTIHSVISGDSPWLMLRDGTKVVIGGTYGGYRLTAIEDGSITFEGPRTTVIPR
ncbi:type III secretion system inner membrane ring subunit SctD [Bordetella flabilis]|nr:type III secretion system inner membrane ring subunit SctD [Bordetella flabilis]